MRPSKKATGEAVLGLCTPAKGWLTVHARWSDEEVPNLLRSNGYQAAFVVRIAPFGELKHGQLDPQWLLGRRIDPHSGRLHGDSPSARTVHRPPSGLAPETARRPGGTDTVVYRAPYSDYFHTDTKVFPAIEFLVEVLRHLPDSRSRLICTYGLYSSRTRGTWSRCPHLPRLAPEGWKRDHQSQPSARIGPPDEPQPELSVPARESRAAWARLINKVYEADPLNCPRCHTHLKDIAEITDPAHVLKILRHLIRITMRNAPPISSVENMPAQWEM